MEITRNEMLREQIAALFDMDGFSEAFFQCGTAENVSKLLAKNGVEATVEELNELEQEGNQALLQMKESADGELSLEQLEDVAGGGRLRRIARGAVSVIGGAALGYGMGCVCAACPAFTPVAYKIAVGYSLVCGVWIMKG